MMLSISLALGLLLQSCLSILMIWLLKQSMGGAHLMYIAMALLLQAINLYLYAWVVMYLPMTVCWLVVSGLSACGLLWLDVFLLAYPLRLADFLCMLMIFSGSGYLMFSR